MHSGGASSARARSSPGSLRTMRQSPFARSIARCSIAALGLKNGVSHTEFIKLARGRLASIFLETAARVGGAYIAEVVEFAYGGESLGRVGPLRVCAPAAGNRTYRSALGSAPTLRRQCHLPRPPARPADISVRLTDDPEIVLPAAKTPSCRPDRAFIEPRRARGADARSATTPSVFSDDFLRRSMPCSRQADPPEPQAHENPHAKHRASCNFGDGKGRADVVSALGLEPRTNALKGRCSTN